MSIQTVRRLQKIHTENRRPLSAPVRPTVGLSWDRAVEDADVSHVLLLDPRASNITSDAAPRAAAPSASRPISAAMSKPSLKKDVTPHPPLTARGVPSGSRRRSEVAVPKERENVRDNYIKAPEAKKEPPNAVLGPSVRNVQKCSYAAADFVRRPPYSLARSAGFRRRSPPLRSLCPSFLR